MVFPLRLLGLVVSTCLPFSGSTSAAREVDPRFFPPAAIFRTLQLSTLACGRENTISDCESAREQADPLLDHPRLSMSCKDVLWRIDQKARAASRNSYGRRHEIDRAAQDVTIFCRQRAMRQDQPAPAAP